VCGLLSHCDRPRLTQLPVVGTDWISAKYDTVKSEFCTNIWSTLVLNFHVRVHIYMYVYACGRMRVCVLEMLSTLLVLAAEI
jgi:hypothetical protein